MDKDSLIKQINTFLDKSPFEDDEIFFWQKNILEMEEKELEELFGLLKDKLKIITDANNLFIKIAEEELQERDKRQEIIPVKASIVDMTINDLAKVFNGNILDILKDENTDIYSELDKYFNNSKLAGENVIRNFDILIKALYENKNIFTRKYKDFKSVSIGDWLKFYNVFNNDANRTSIDRITFVSGNEKARKLDQERKDVLLKLLKLYDFLLNPSNVEIGAESLKFKARPEFAERVSSLKKDQSLNDKFQKVEEGIEGGDRVKNHESGIMKQGKHTPTPLEEGNLHTPTPLEEGNLQKQVGLFPSIRGDGGVFVADSAKKAYVFSLSEQEVIKQNEDDIKRIARGNIILVGKELTKALETKNRPRVIAALRIAVKNNLLIGWSYKHEKRETEHEKREDNKIVISFLKQVLQEKLGLSENEAAKIGVHLFNLFKKQGRDVGYLAYYDEGEGKFRWME